MANRKFSWNAIIPGITEGDMMVYNADRTCEGFIHYTEKGKEDNYYSTLFLHFKIVCPWISKINVVAKRFVINKVIIVYPMN